LNALTTIQPSRLPIAPAIAKEFDIQPTEWRVLVDQIFPAAKSVESVMMALAYCRKRNLDIFKKPVHIVPMWSTVKKQMVETVWPGIAEIRTTASRTGQYAGIDAVEFGPMLDRSFTGTVGKDQREETITKKVRFPEWASVVVYRIVGSEKCAYHAKVYWEETYATVGKSEVPNEMWAKRPRGQLDKCVEAAALRKAFPEELGNTYAAEEMEGRTIEGTVEPAAPQPPKPPAPPALRQADIVDAETGEVIDDRQIVRETGEATETLVEDEGDPNAFFSQLEADMASAMDAATVEEVWTHHDPLARFENDDINQGIASAIKRRRLMQIEKSNAKG
jgi:phage recombination protein Bet